MKNALYGKLGFDFNPLTDTGSAFVRISGELGFLAAD